jgi:methionyl-tRNA formyltransferase
MRLLFAGTPVTALPTLHALLASDHEVVAVLTRPDARSGRGRVNLASPIAQAAEAAGVEVLRPRRPGDAEFVDRLAELAPDCCPVVAYGALLPARILDIPRYGWVNLHFSLLPAWRGAAPVQHAIRAGDDITGATTFRIVEQLDAGPVFGVVTETIRPRDTTGDLLERLSHSGAELLLRTLDGIEAGALAARPQPEEGVTHAARVSVDDARVDWLAPAVAVDRQIRACTPDPGAWTTLRGERIGLGPVLPVLDEPSPPPGRIVAVRHRVIAGTTTGAVELSDVQRPGKRPTPAAEWARGARLTDADGFE